MKKRQDLAYDGVINLVDQLTDDFVRLSYGLGKVTDSRTYSVKSAAESPNIKQAARKAVFEKLTHDTSPLIKVAFDTRKIDQDNDRNPRSNLQYWNRSQQFIDEETQRKMESLAKLVKPLDHIHDKYGTHPEYFQSFARSLHDSIKRVVKVGDSDINVFRPQIDYLEQLLYARYRLSLEDITKLGAETIVERILSKDENLLKRGSFLPAAEPPKAPIIKNNVPAITQDSIVNAIFGNNEFRRDGEKSVTRTITITIKDEVND